MRLLCRQGVVAALLFCCAVGLVLWPGEVSAAAREGLALCGNVILPSLFPFFVLSSLTISLGLAGYLGRALAPVMGPLFRLGGPCAAPLVLGFVGGYPVGARAALTLYQTGGCTRTECERLLAFCNNSGPAFILGVVGAGVFNDSRVGLLLWGVHALASLLVGLCFRFYRWREPKTAGTALPIRACRFTAAFTRAVGDSGLSCLHISAFVVTFTVLLRLAFLSGLLPLLAELLGRIPGLDPAWGRRLLTGLVELSSGVWALAGEGPLRGRVAMAAFLLGWAGLSVHCQVLSFLEETGLNTWTYLGGKLLHGLFSAILTALALRFLPLPVSGVLTEQVEGIAGMDLPTAFTLSSWWAWGVFLVFFLLSLLGLEKREKV